MKRRHQEEPSKFLALENQFLNTFYSGLYLSAGDFIAIGNRHGVTMEMHAREMLIKDLLNKSQEIGTLGDVIASLNRIIDERIDAYHRLSLQYPGSRVALSRLAQKANGTKALLAREAKGNPYEH